MLIVSFLAAAMSDGIIAPQVSKTSKLEVQEAATVASDHQILAKMQRIEEWAEQQSFSGVAGIARNGRLLDVRAFGFADEQSGRKNTVKTRFQTGSITKYFASVLAYRLAAKGVIDLRAPITDILPGFRADTGARISLDDLMTSSSGIPGMLGQIMGEIAPVLAQGGTLDDTPYADLTIDQVIEDYADGDLEFEPGSEFDYENTNWIVVVRALEVASGKPYAQLIEEELFRPAGMTGSGTFEMIWQNLSNPTDDYAVGVAAEGSRLPGDWPLPAFMGGGTYTTAADLVALDAALYGAELFGAGWLKRFQTVRFEDDAYAFGGRHYVEDVAGRDRRLSYQTGSNGASRTAILTDKDSGWSIVFLANRGNGADGFSELGLELLGDLLAE